MIKVHFEVSLCKCSGVLEKAMTW